MLTVRWLPTARDRLRSIIDYIDLHDQAAGDRMEARIGRVVAGLPAFPLMYRVGRVAGTREAVVHPNYILVYSVGASEITIVTIRHAKQDAPPQTGA